MALDWLVTKIQNTQPCLIPNTVMNINANSSLRNTKTAVAGSIQGVGICVRDLIIDQKLTHVES